MKELWFVNAALVVSVELWSDLEEATVSFVVLIEKSSRFEVVDLKECVGCELGSNVCIWFE